MARNIFMQKLERLSLHPISETIDAIQKFCYLTKNLSSKEAKIHIDKRTEFSGQLVRLGSVRLQTFAAYGTTCVCCNKKATHFAMERHLNNEVYHLNLYGIDDDGSELLFTHDHILARSLGGPDHICNTQTMCTKCNSYKSIGEHKEFMLRKTIKKNIQNDFSSKNNVAVA